MKSNARAILLVLALLAVIVALNFVFFIDTRAAEENERTADRSSYRATRFGALAFYTLLEESGYPVTRFERPFTELKQDGPGTLVLVSLPDSNNPSQEEFESLNEWLSAGGLLIVIDRDVHITLGDAQADTEHVFSGKDARPIQPTSYTRGVGRVQLSEYATRIRITKGAATYHIGDSQGAVLADVKVGNGRAIFLTDPYVVANNGIREADNVVLALNLFTDRPAGAIAFDEYHHGYGAATTSGGVIAYFRGTPVPWMMWQAGLIVALVVYSFGRRFARPVPIKRERRTTNLEFVSSMANITRLARASDLAMQNVYSEFRKRLCRFSALPVTAQNEKIAAAVSRRAQVGESEINHLLARCEQIARGEQVGDSELLRLVTRIREIESRLGI
ncbi:MAG TPA: DUF4350 domain-containing protein [Blastocatellia bacterium]|nr:DUF4350 domain-containing protein [Blastocatellia bacterium]